MLLQRIGHISQIKDRTHMHDVCMQTPSHTLIRTETHTYYLHIIFRQTTLACLVDNKLSHHLFCSSLSVFVYLHQDICARTGFHTLIDHDISTTFVIPLSLHLSLASSSAIIQYHTVSRKSGPHFFYFDLNDGLPHLTLYTPPQKLN